MKKILFLFFLAISVGIYPNKNEESYEKLINKIVKSFIKETEAKYNLHCYGVGGAMPYDIESIMVSFQKEGRFKSLAEARYLEVVLTKTLNEKINSDKKIRPYLHYFPFPISKTNIKLMIFDTENFPEDEIVFVAQKDDRVFYAMDNGRKFVTKYDESFSDAEEKLKSYHSDK
jgi:hypothetical protein